MEKITKKQARKYFKEGRGIRLVPSKCGHQSLVASTVWPCYNEANFEHICDAFKYYNCSKVTGLSIHFYISDYEKNRTITK